MIAIVDYKAGNLTSVKLALGQIGQESRITSDCEIILGCERVIFPGVGAAGAAMKTITERGLEDTLQKVIASGKPLLGICLGAQIVLGSSQENDGTRCLGLIPGTTELFHSSEDCPIKVPQIGWNQVEIATPHPVLEGIASGSEFYFVHSYYPCPSESSYTLATTTYGNVTFTSILGKENLVACQFHPEKSGTVGLKLLENFCRWNGGLRPC